MLIYNIQEANVCDLGAALGVLIIAKLFVIS